MALSERQRHVRRIVERLIEMFVVALDALFVV